MENPLPHPKHWPLTPGALAQRAPRTYLWLATSFMLLGHAITLGFPLAALILLVGLPNMALTAQGITDWAAVLLQLGLLAGTGAMSLFLYRQKIPLPPGHPLDADRRQPLDELIASIPSDARLGSPYAVRFTDRHQLTTACVPRNGYALFGRQVLLLGLPTVLALTPKLAQAGLRRILTPPDTTRGRLLRMIACHHDCWQSYRAFYRNQRTLPGRIMAAVARAYLAGCRRVCAPALRWHELERDTLLNQQICVEDVLELVAADAVVRLYLDTVFWPAVQDSAKHTAEPPRPLAMLQSSLPGQLTREAVNRLVAQAMHEIPDEHADAPAVVERLANLGCRTFGLVEPLGESIASTLLPPDALQPAIARFDDRWCRDMTGTWRRTHAKHAKNRKRLTALRRRAMGGRIQGDEAMAYAKLAKHYLEPEQATAVYRQIARMNSEDATLLLGLGRLLLANDDQYGIRLAKRAARLEPRLIAKVRKVLLHYPASVEEGRRLGMHSGKVA